MTETNVKINFDITKLANQEARNEIKALRATIKKLEADAVLIQKINNRDYEGLTAQYTNVKSELDFLKKNRTSLDRKVADCLDSLELLSVDPYKKDPRNLTLEQCSDLWSQMDDDLCDIKSAIYRLNNLAKELRKEFNPKRTTKKK